MKILLNDPSAITRLSNPRTLYVDVLGEQHTLEKVLNVARVRFVAGADSNTATISVDTPKGRGNRKAAMLIGTYYINEALGEEILPRIQIQKMLVGDTLTVTN